LVPDVRSTVSMDVKDPNDLLYIVGKTFKELGGSEYYKLKGFLGKTVPKARGDQGRRIFKAVTKAIDSGLVRACHDLSEGGLGVAVAEMAFSGGYGVEFDLGSVPSEGLDRDDFVLFSESDSRFLVEVSKNAKESFELLMRGNEFAEIGKVTKSPRLRIRGMTHEVVVDVSLSDLVSSWKRTFRKEA